jgi:uncharacterized protein YkwD
MPILTHMIGISRRIPGQVRFHRLAAVVALALFTALAGSAVAARESGGDVGERVIELVNVARSKGRKCGSVRYAAAPPLTEAPELSKAARRHARDMARRNFFEHDGSDGSQPKDRVLRAGYEPRLTGENIALGPETAEEAVAGWLASPGHCENIMEPRFRHIGVGVATGRGRGKIYWVQDFGAPR